MEDSMIATTSLLLLLHGFKGTRHLVQGLGAAGLGHVDADEDEVPGLLVVVVPALEPGVVGHPVAGRAHAAAAHLVIGCDINNLRDLKLIVTI